MSENVSPEAEENCAMRSALSGWPSFVIGCPSSVVIWASGVPGVLKRIAGTAPPTVPPFMTPIRKPMTGNSASGLKPKAEIKCGSETAMAMGAARPGVEPTTMPRRKTLRIITGVAGRPKKASSGPAKTTATPARI